LQAFWNTTNHQTTLYGVADARFFDTNTVSATTGFSHSYEPRPDVVLNSQFNYTRQTDIFTSALNFNNGAIGPVNSPTSSAPLFINPFGTSPGVNPIAYNQYTLTGYATKKFGADDRGFVTVGAAGFYLAYDHSTDLSSLGPTIAPFNTSHDGTNYQFSGRLGYHVAPSLYVFADGSGIFQRFNNSLFNTNGYRVTGGIGSDDPKSLLTGEIYGGYQAQHEQSDQILNPIGFPLLGIPLNSVTLGTPFPSGIPQNTDSSVFGGRIYYFPTRRWALMAQVDEVLGIATAFCRLAPGWVTREPVLSGSTNWIMATWRVPHSITKYGGICMQRLITNIRPCARIRCCPSLRATCTPPVLHTGTEQLTRWGACGSGNAHEQTSEIDGRSSRRAGVGAGGCIRNAVFCLQSSEQQQRYHGVFGSSSGADSDASACGEAAC
jgi:hypothetical protein